jgi:hypothetical protein
MAQRGFSEEVVKQILRSGNVIEDYPQDTPYPSYLMLGWVSHRPVHVVAADNRTEKQTIVITVYEPDPKQWDTKFERRKK